MLEALTVDMTLAIAQTAFNKEETQRAEHIYFIENYISKINSSNQIQPAVKVLTSLNTTNVELARLGHGFSTALARIPTDDRSFSAPWNSTMGSIDALVAKFKERGLPNDEIIESYRAYLINQLTGQRCAETDSAKEQGALETSLVTHFNERLGSLAYKNIALIAEDDIKPGRREGSVRDEVYWTSAKSKSLLSAMRRLRFKSPGKEFNAQEKESAEAAAASWSYSHFLGYLLEAELQERHRRTVKLNLQFARFPYHKRLEDFDYAAQPAVDRRLIDELATCRFLHDGRSIVFLGAARCGQNSPGYFALGLLTAEAGHRVYFTTATWMTRRLSKALAENRLHRELHNLTRHKLLIIDEVGYLQLDQTQASLFFQVISQRYDNNSAIILISN